MEISLNKIICDIQSRVNDDLSNLCHNLMMAGQLEPLLVEGPDENKNYYLIHGYRRLMAMKMMPDKFKLAKCTIINNKPTSKENRNFQRFMIVTALKKHSGIEQQFIYDNIPDDTKKEGIIPKYLNNKMIKGESVPKEDREKAIKERKSFDALHLIYTIKCTEEFREKLKRKYWIEGLITCEEATAIKKVSKHELYAQLSEEQRERVIEEVIRNAKFTKEKAGFIILQEIMKSEPKHDIQKVNMNSWIKYICSEIEKINNLINIEISPYVKITEKKEIELTLDSIANKLMKVINSQSNEEKYNGQQKVIYHDFTGTNPDNRVIGIEKFINYESYDGVKITFIYR